jgi:small subunit ribosomal protein S16
MAVVLRLQRKGKPHTPHYRVVAVNKTNSVRGEALEVVGHYHPTEAKEKDKLTLDLTRVEHWVKNGAKPSDKVLSLIRQAKRAAKA